MIMATDGEVQSVPDDLMYSVDKFPDDIMQEGLKSLPPGSLDMIKSFLHIVSPEDLVILSLAAVHFLQEELGIDDPTNVPDKDMTLRVTQLCIGMVCGDYYFENTESEYRLFWGGNL